MAREKDLQGFHISIIL